MTTNNATNTGNLYSAGNGKILISQNTGQAIPANITAGTGITITNGVNTITVASNGASNVVDQTTASVTMSVNTVYVCDAGASLITFTIPTTAALGDFFEIVGASTGGWTIAESTGQTLHVGAVAATLTTGTVASTNQYDCIRFRCTTANTTFVTTSAVGNLTIT